MGYASNNLLLDNDITEYEMWRQWQEDQAELYHYMQESDCLEPAFPENWPDQGGAQDEGQQGPGGRGDHKDGRAKQEEGAASDSTC